MEPTTIPPKLLPGADFLPVKHFPELTSEEAALRHRLELKVERALYKVAVWVSSVGRLQILLSPFLAGPHLGRQAEGRRSIYRRKDGTTGAANS